MLDPLDNCLRLIVIGQQVPCQIGGSPRIEDVDRRYVDRQHLRQASLARGQRRDPARSRLERYEAEPLHERGVQDQCGVGEQPGLLGVRDSSERDDRGAQIDVTEHLLGFRIQGVPIGWRRAREDEPAAPAARSELPEHPDREDPVLVMVRRAEAEDEVVVLGLERSRRALRPGLGWRGIGTAVDDRSRDVAAEHALGERGVAAGLTDERDTVDGGQRQAGDLAVIQPRIPAPEIRGVREGDHVELVDDDPRSESPECVELSQGAHLVRAIDDRGLQARGQLVYTSVHEVDMRQLRARVPSRRGAASVASARPVCRPDCSGQAPVWSRRRHAGFP